MLRKPLTILLCTLMWASIPVGAADTCGPILLGEPDLDAVLDQALGSMRDFVETSKVTIAPEDTNCYVHIALTTKDVPVLMPSCEMHACSVAVLSGTRIALRAFDITGCDALFSALAVPRHVPVAYADGSERIRTQCGTKGFELRSATPKRIGSTPVVSLEVRETPAPHP